MNGKYETKILSDKCKEACQPKWKKWMLNSPKRWCDTFSSTKTHTYTDHFTLWITILAHVSKLNRCVSSTCKIHWIAMQLDAMKLNYISRKKPHFHMCIYDTRKITNPFYLLANKSYMADDLRATTRQLHRVLLFYAWYLAMYLCMNVWEWAWTTVKTD